MSPAGSQADRQLHLLHVLGVPFVSELALPLQRFAHISFCVALDFARVLVALAPLKMMRGHCLLRVQFRLFSLLFSSSPLPSFVFSSSPTTKV